MDYEAAFEKEHAVTSGLCGDNLMWRLEGNTLYIEGTGDLRPYLGDAWRIYRNEIEHVVISPGCTSIDSYAFWYHSVLKTIQLPNTLRTIGRYAFAYCYSLEEALLPDTVIDFGQSVFRGCHNLRRVHIPVQLRVLPKCTFCGCYNLTSITIPDGVTGIGERAFKWCSRLNCVTIPESVMRIGKDAFFCCDNLTSVTIPGSVRVIGEGAFSHCKSKIEILIPDGVPKVGIFDSSTIWIERDIIGIGLPEEYDPYPTKGRLVIGETELCWTLGHIKVSQPVSEMKIVEKYSGLTNVTILNGVAEIGDYAFAYCESLTSITIPESVTKIGSGAFLECGRLTNVKIGENAFKGVPRILYNRPARLDDNGAH